MLLVVRVVVQWGNIRKGKGIKWIQLLPLILRDHIGAIVQHGVGPYLRLQVIRRRIVTCKITCSAGTIQHCIPIMNWLLIWYGLYVRMQLI